MSKLVLFFSFSAFILTSLFAAKVKKEEVPLWVQDPSFVYATNEYLSNLGQGKTQKEAETDALSGLVAIFNRSIASSTQASLSYSVQQSEESAKIEKSKDLKQNVKISTNMDDLIGVEIREHWKSQDGTFYALAIIEKEKGARLYREKASDCISGIDELLDVVDANKGTFVGYFKCREAFNKSQGLQVYKGCLAVLDASARGISGRRGEGEYSDVALKVKADKIAKNIEIFVDISPDAKKIKPHFEKIFSKYSFTLSKDSSARYRLSIQLELDEPIELSQGRMAIRYNLAIELFDTKQDETVFPFAFEGKETHFDVNSVKNKIFKTLEKKALDEFAISFAKFAASGR